MTISPEAFRNLEEAYVALAESSDILAELGMGSREREEDLKDFEDFIVGLSVSQLIEE